MTQRTREHGADSEQQQDDGDGATSRRLRTEELEEALHERTKEQKRALRQLQLVESRLEQVERERDDLLDQIAELEADLESPRNRGLSPEEVKELEERHRAELDDTRHELARAKDEVDSLNARLQNAREQMERLGGLQGELENAREEAAARSRETEELRVRLRSLESRDAERESLRLQVTALEEELTVLRKQNRDLESLVLDANSEVERNRKRADELWQQVTGPHPRMNPDGTPAGPRGDGGGPAHSNDDAPAASTTPGIRGGDLSRLADETGQLGPTAERPPIEVSETADGTVDMREVMKDTAEMVGNEPFEVPDRMRELARSEADGATASSSPSKKGTRRPKERDRSRLAAILSGEGTVDGDAPWESLGEKRLEDPAFTEAPTRDHPRVTETGSVDPVDEAEPPPAAERDTVDFDEGDASDVANVAPEHRAEPADEEPSPEVEIHDDGADVGDEPVTLRSEPEPAEEEDDDQGDGEQRDVATVGIDDLDDRAEFERRLHAGVRFQRTDRFGKIDLINRIDIQVSDWLSQTCDLAGVQEISGGRMNEARLLDVMWVFFQRRMFLLEDG